MKDKERAKKIARSVKLLYQAEQLLTEVLVPSQQNNEICFSLYGHAVSLESQVAYYKTGEMDPIR